MDFGTAFGVGIDGEMSGSVMFKIVNWISERYPQGFLDEELGFDFGSGSGMASFLLSFGLGLKMVGFELNGNRALYSWNLQKFLLDQTSSYEYKYVATRSKFFFSEASKGLKQQFGNSRHIRSAALVYSFTEGWGPGDLVDLMGYICLYFPNIQFMICDKDSRKLYDIGFKREIYESVKFSGPMNNSSNCRTLYIHRLQCPKNTQRALRISDVELKTIDRFHRVTQAQLEFDILSFQSKQKEERATRQQRNIRPVSTEIKAITESRHQLRGVSATTKPRSRKRVDQNTANLVKKVASKRENTTTTITSSKVNQIEEESLLEWKSESTVEATESTEMESEYEVLESEFKSEMIDIENSFPVQNVGNQATTVCLKKRKLPSIIFDEVATFTCYDRYIFRFTN